jgi:hypothetical protein
MANAAKHKVPMLSSVVNDSGFIGFLYLDNRITPDKKT